MNNLRHAATRTPSCTNAASIIRGRAQPAVALRRTVQDAQRSHIHSFTQVSSHNSASLHRTALRSQFLPEQIQTSPRSASSIRSFHQGARLNQEKDPKSAGEKPIVEEETKKASSEEPGSKAEGEEKSKEEGESEGKKEEEKKEAPPPPPPHGDKSPWQVFTDTLSSEFKASKEWNESTKALAAGAQQFTENESVRRAREAYEKSTGAVTSTAGKVLKTTAGAVGHGAAWTWDTSVVKGVRTTVNATATVIEKGTRPIRETEAYKNVKNVIDDGSSSRYGGWVEKEERKRIRELREKEAGRGGKRMEVAQEDPE